MRKVSFAARKNHILIRGKVKFWLTSPLIWLESTSNNMQWSLWALFKPHQRHPLWGTSSCKIEGRVAAIAFLLISKRLVSKSGPTTTTTTTTRLRLAMASRRLIVAHVAQQWRRHAASSSLTTNGYIRVVTCSLTYTDYYKLRPEVLGWCKTCVSNREGVRTESCSVKCIIVVNNITCDVNALALATATLRPAFKRQPQCASLATRESTTFTTAKVNKLFFWAMSMR